MISDKTKPTTLHDHLMILSKQAGAVRNALDTEKDRLPQEAVENIKRVADESDWSRFVSFISGECEQALAKVKELNPSFSNDDKTRI